MNQPEHHPELEAVQQTLPGVDLTPDKLTTLIVLSKKLEEGHVAIEQAEAAIEQLKESQKNLEQVTLPDLMLSLGLTEITLKSGRKIQVVQDYYPNITKEKQVAAHAWLREHNMGSIIKSGLVVETENEPALVLANVPFEKKEAVHPRTLQSFVREQLEGPGKAEFPAELFGVFVLSHAVVKNVK